MLPGKMRTETPYLDELDRGNARCGIARARTERARALEGDARRGLGPWRRRPRAGAARARALGAAEAAPRRSPPPAPRPRRLLTLPDLPLLLLRLSILDLIDLHRVAACLYLEQSCIR